MLLKVIVIWTLLSIIVAAVFCRLMHNAKVADRALKIARPDPQPPGQKVDSTAMTRDKSGGDDPDCHAA
ncbi:putative lipoprotein [Pseudomonas fluorescens]|uniref:Putative lipoprotein n=1 Tax=Pseudomonas fluorescens TaxID=294 RepID=A0A0N8NXQ8_PSEFL|nr:hypothetical protein [Pseudomonas fluorescens]KPU60881.1 putative lipoprotein [Pseudomonas fluorescens]